jgi:hypothetical protein
MNRVPAVWEVFGGSLLGVAAVGLLTAYNALAANVAELRREVVALQFARGEYATAAEFELASGRVSAALAEVEGVPAAPSGRAAGSGPEV